MSQERIIGINLPRDVAPEVKALQVSARAALERLTQALPGDRSEAVRYEHIQSAIVAVALPEINRVAQAMPAKTRSPVEFEYVWPFAVGPTPQAEIIGGAAKPVAPVFRSKLSTPNRKAAVKERFEAQLRRAVEVGSNAPSPVAINPSEMPNDVLTKSLRRFVHAARPTRDLEVAVVYRDGSPARPVRLHSLRFLEQMPDDGRLVLRLTLLSIRHMEMDLKVDGAWLRNKEISRPRPMGETDELVYRQSREQLARLTSANPVALHICQTGLPPAVLGFYRAVIDHHLEGGRSVAVLPQFFRGERGFESGKPWFVAE